MGLSLFFLPNFPGATFIPDSRVGVQKVFDKITHLVFLWSEKKGIKFANHDACARLNVDGNLSYFFQLIFYVSLT